MRQTLAFARHLRKLGAESCSIRNCLPIPGTRLWQIAEKGNNLLITKEQTQDHLFLHSGGHFLTSKDWSPKQVEVLTRFGQQEDSEHRKQRNKIIPLLKLGTILPRPVKRILIRIMRGKR